MGFRYTPRSTHRWLAMAALLPLAAAACNNPTELPPTRNTTLNVYLKDQAGDVDKVWLQIDDVVLKGDTSTMSMLDAPTALIDVTALQTSVATLAKGVEVPTGTYNELRLVLGGAVLQSGDQVYAFGGAEDPDGKPTTGTLQCPSCSQSGIKVKLSNTLAMTEGANGVLMDFDVSQSFGHVAGTSGKWVMHPVIHGNRAEPGQIEGGETEENIVGTVAVPLDETSGEPTVDIPMCGGKDRTLADFVPTATSTTLTDSEDNPLVFTGKVEFVDDGQGGGSYRFKIGVTGADDFTLDYEPETVFDTDKLVWTAEVDPTTVTVPTGNTEAGHVDAAYTVTAVTCEPVPTS